MLTDHWYIAHPVSRPGPARVGGRDVADLPTRVHQHYVWAWYGDGEPSHDPPDLAPLARAGYAFEQRTIRVRANWQLVLENSLDFAHSAYVHPFTQPSWALHQLGGALTMQATYRPTPDGLQVDGKLGRFRAYAHSFALPDRLRLVVLPDTPVAVDLVVHHVPEDERTTRMEVLMGRRALPFEGREPRFKDGLLLIHEQDVAIVEAQQAALDAGPTVVEQHCAADAYTLLLRRVLDAAAQGGWTPPDVEPRTIAMRV